MNTIKSFFAVSILSSILFSLSGCGTFTKNDLQNSASINTTQDIQKNTAQNSPKNTLQSESCQCYWMENYSGQYKWIPSESIQGMKRKITKTECYKLDSCDGGLGHSNGGCYKWALAPENTRIPW